MGARVLAFRRPATRRAVPADASPAARGEPKARPTHRPVLPSWLLHRDEFASTLKWAVGHAAHASAFHGVRAPKYAGRLVICSPRGAWRAASTTLRYVFDLDGLQVARHAAGGVAAGVLPGGT